MGCFWGPASGGRVGWRRAGLEISQAKGLGPPSLPRDSMLPCRGLSHFSASCQPGGQALKPAVQSKCFTKLAWLRPSESRLPHAQCPAATCLLPHGQPPSRCPPSKNPDMNPLVVGIVPMLTRPGARLGLHGCCHCHREPQQLWGPGVKISQLSKPQCGFLPPRPPRPQHQGFPQSLIATPLCF